MLNQTDLVFDDDGVRDLKHECAVFMAVRRPSADVPERSVLQLVLNGLKVQSNRGQEGIGIASVSADRDGSFQIYHSTRSINEIAKSEPEEQQKIFQDFEAEVLIGHNRYATHGPADASYLQPMQNALGTAQEPVRGKVIAFNGHIANADRLRAELIEDGYSFAGDSDTEVLLQLINQSSEETPADYAKIFSRVDQKIDGACSLVLLDAAGHCVLYRHSNGIRPLELFESDDGAILAASETEAFQGIKGQHRIMNPGEVFVFDIGRDSFTMSRVGKSDLKYCVMELLYFSRANSLYQGVSHYRIRRDIGELMANHIRDRFDGISAFEKSRMRVVPVPNTAIPFALGISNALDIPYEMGIERRENTRAFINSRNQRLAVLQRKFGVLQEAVAGNVVLVVDDTLIRRDTSITVTKLLRDAGAERVEWLICAPPFRGTCYYGIAVPSVEELAYWRAVKTLPPRQIDSVVAGDDLTEIETRISQDIGSDSLTFLPYDKLLSALPGEPTGYCHGCFRGLYPTEYGQTAFDKKKKTFMDTYRSKMGDTDE